MQCDVSKLQTIKQRLLEGLLKEANFMQLVLIILWAVQMVHSAQNLVHWRKYSLLDRVYGICPAKSASQTFGQEICVKEMCLVFVQML